MARPASGDAGHDNRNGRARRPSATGRRERHRAQYHHQLAPDFRRRLAAIVRALSLVDAVFAADSRFEDMDFPTRTLYRSAVEELARGSKRTELDIAGAAVLAASRERRAAPAAEQARRGDPGYHLLAGGRRAFEAALSYRPPHGKLAGAGQPVAWRRRLCDGDFACRGDASCGAAVRPCRGGSRAWPFSVCLASSAPFPPSTPPSRWSIAAVNLGFAATLLPALELRDGVPSHLRTLVAVPTLLTTLEGDRGTNRAAGDPSSRQPRRRSAFRAGFRLDRLGDRTRRGRRGACRRGGGRRRASQSALWPGAGRRPLSAAASPSRLERRRSAVDRLGAQARQAARTEPAAARRDRHHVHRRRRRAARRARRYPLRRDARRGHAVAARYGAPPDRQDGASAEPATLRCGRRQGGGGLCGAAAARDAFAADRPRGLAVPAHLLQPERNRSLRLGGLGRLSGSVRRRLLCGQRHL